MPFGYFHTRQTVAIVLAIFCALAPGRAQSAEGKNDDPAGQIWGYIRDANGSPLSGVSISLQSASGTQSTRGIAIKPTQTNSTGIYRFSALASGIYKLHAQAKGYSEGNAGPVSLSADEAKQVDLSLIPATTGSNTPSAAAKSQNSAPTEFFDEPQFTVAGVTQATNAGGHGSDTALRTTEALAKATLSLGKESSNKVVPAPSAVAEASLRKAVESNSQDASLHHQFADLEEHAGNPLEAVRQYQRAAELDPSEANLFDWGTELLTHRALEPASEVFLKANRLFPQSVRVLVALGVTWYARGSYERASQSLEKASDLAPDDLDPYLFLGEIVSVEPTPSPGSVGKLSRFAEVQPGNVLANCYYAIALLKQSANAGDTHGQQDTTRSARIESLLNNALRIDPNFAPAYLQLGVLSSRHGLFEKAIPLYQKAIELSSNGDDTQAEAHYRLSQAYARIGDKEQAKRELALRDAIVKQNKADSERGRKEIKEFVISQKERAIDSSHPHN